MSMLILVATLTLVGAEPTGAPLEVLTDRWEAECRDADDTPECSGLAADIELGFYDLLRKLSLSRQPVDRDVLRAAAESDLPPLARLGVSLLGEPQSKQDADALLQAVDHPVLAVRYIAARNLASAQDPRWMAMQMWWTGWTLAPNANAPEESLIPDPRPQPDQFSMTSFKYMDYHYYGSDLERAMFTTAESAESFVKRLSAKRRVLSSMDALSLQMELLQPDLDAVQNEMEAAGEKNDMDALQKALKKYETLSKRMAGAANLSVNPMVASHTVILKEDLETKRATCTVLVQRDEKLNRTVLLFWREGGWRH